MRSSWRTLSCGERQGPERSVIERFHDIMDIQSVGAAIQNMLLAAMDAGVGSL